MLILLRGYLSWTIRPVISLKTCPLLFPTRFLPSDETGTRHLWGDRRKVTCHLCRLVWMWHTHPWEVVRPHTQSCPGGRLLRRWGRRRRRRHPSRPGGRRRAFLSCYHGHCRRVRLFERSLLSYVWTSRTINVSQNSHEFICNIGLNFSIYQKCHDGEKSAGVWVNQKCWIRRENVGKLAPKV